MFKLNRNRPAKAGDKIEFRFSHLQVSQVPKGWDKLFISLISVGSGKTIGKTSRALVRHGNCQWIEAFSECKSLPQAHTPRDLEEFTFKFVVSMGSGRTSVLGEATLNLTDHTTPRDAVPVSLPLTVYSEGPILLLSVECVNPRPNTGEGRQWSEKNLRHDDADVDNKSDGSDIIINRSIGSSPGHRLASNSYKDEHAHRETNRSASGSHRSSDSGDSFMGRTKLSPMASMSGTSSQIWRQDSSEEVAGSVSSPLNPKWTGPNRWQDRNNDPLKVLLEAAQETIEELRGEARLWERKARKLKADLETLRKEHKEQSKHKEDVDKRLRDAHLENERLRSSIEELQALDTVLTSKNHQNAQLQRQEELQDELKFQRESNTSLSLQLKKTQESNIELVSILQELEETIEKQRLEITSLSEKTSSAEKWESSAFGVFQNGIHDSELKREIFDLKVKIQELEEECVELSKQNLALTIKVKETNKESKSFEWSDKRKDQAKRSNLVESLGIALIDSNISSLCLEDMNHEMETLKARLSSQISANKLLEQKLRATQEQLSEAEEESEYLQRSNSKLQATVESLIEECNSVQRLVSEVKRQKLELHEHSSLLEIQLKESEKKNAEFDNRIETLEAGISALQRDASVKERSLLSEVEALFQYQKEQGENLAQANELLSQMELGKEAEIESLKREVARLTAQLSPESDDVLPITSDALEISQLRADKLKLENSLQEALARVKSNESDMQNIRQELGSNIQSLMGLLNVSKEREDTLMADIGRLKRQMDKMKAGEEKINKSANELKLKLKSSEYEKQQLAEELSSMKAQLTKISELQDEVVFLKSFLDERNFEKTKLEKSLALVSDERENLKGEISLCREKIGAMQKALSDLESDRQNKLGLEEKLLRLENDLRAKEAAKSQELELKDELKRMKITNNQYQRRIQCVEDERDDLARKVQVLEMEARSRSSDNGKGKILVTDADNTEPSQSGNAEDLRRKVLSLETELSKALEELDGLRAVKEASASDASKNSAIEGTTQGGGRADRLEIELKEMRERYLQMSLRYAEVEAQREDLVMKLKSTKKEKKWFT